MGEKGEQTISALKFDSEDARKHLHPEAFGRLQLLFESLNQDLTKGINLKALQFYITNKDDKGLDWLYAYSDVALRPFIDLDLQNNDPQLMVLLTQLDADIIKIQIKWHELMKKALDLYIDELDQLAKEEGERLARVAKEEEERQTKELEEQRKRVKEKKIDEAYDTLGNPFIADAQHYLPSKEFDKFHESLKGEEMTGTDAEACAYLYTAALTQPMDHDWGQIYLYIATRTYRKWGKNEMPGDIAVDSISDYQMGELNRLKEWLYCKRIQVRVGRSRAELRQKREEEVEKRKAEQPVLFEF